MSGTGTVGLSALLSRVRGARFLVGGPEIKVTGLARDSRRVLPGDLFFALKGEGMDGHDYIGQAVREGAAAVVCDRKVASLPPVPCIQVPDSRLAAAHMAAAFHDEPFEDLDVVGITGTNGKSTTTFILRSLLEAAGRKPGLLGTVMYDLGDEIHEASETTPGPIRLARYARRMVQAGCDSLVMEVSSHSLAQRRVDGVPFRVGVFTNLTRDHLDYHGTMEAYLEAKKRLFENLGPQSAAVIPVDSPWGVSMAAAARHGETLLFGFGEGTQIGARIEQLSLTGTRFTLALPSGRYPVGLRLVGRFNVSNALAAAGAAWGMGMSPAEIVRGLECAQGAPGRLEAVGRGEQGIHVLVDYAHTDDALANVLTALRPMVSGRILLVFGAGGDRDAGKRPLMGSRAAAGANQIWVTNDNPRSEDPQEIARAIEEGIGDRAPYRVVLDREEAIGLAIEEAQPGDLVLVAGKGHEAYQEIGKFRHPFDDREVARTALERRLRRGVIG